MQSIIKLNKYKKTVRKDFEEILVELDAQFDEYLLF